jgi:hypothetical protein
MIQDSVWHSKLGRFRDFLKDIADKNLTILEVLDEWKEKSFIPEDFKKMKVQELLNNPKYIEELYYALKKRQPDRNFKFPYNKKEREKELIELLSQDYNILAHRAHVKIVSRFYQPASGDGVPAFSFGIEAAMAPFNDGNDRMAGEFDFIGSINSGMHIIDDGSGFYSDGFFRWNSKTGKTRVADSVRGILSKCGFNSDEAMSKRRFHSVLYLNLLTPIPDWSGGAGKTSIELAPYADAIASTVSSLAYQMPSYHGHGYNATPVFGRDDSQNATDYLRKFLRNRKAAIDANPSLRITDRITQSGVWYRIRPEMVEKKFNPPESWTITRRTLQGSIAKTIEELWPGKNLTREDLGIVAASKGAVFYNGEQWSINGDSADALAEKGVAIIVIEKEGVADTLAPYARKYGIALAHSGGGFTEAIKKMIERTKEGGSVVRILTDFDVVGKDIAAATITPTIRIGIERDIIPWLQKHGHPNLTEKEVEEEYTPSGTTIKITDPYLMKRRIELDSIQEKVGGEKFWEYIMYRLQLPRYNTVFDLTKAIEMPKTESLRPKAVKDAIAKIDDYIVKVTGIREGVIIGQLEESKKLVDITKMEIKIENKLIEKVDESSKNDEGMKTIIEQFQKLSEEDIIPNPDDYDEKNKDEGLDIMDGDDDNGSEDDTTANNSDSNSNEDEKPKTSAKDLSFGEVVRDLGLGEMGDMFDEVFGSSKRKQNDE